MTDKGCCVGAAQRNYSGRRDVPGGTGARVGRRVPAEVFQLLVQAFESHLEEVGAGGTGVKL